MIKQSKLLRGLAKPKFDYIPFGFGLDMVTPSNQTKPGSLRAGKNCEININGGYTWIRGYERYDGRAVSPPSVAANYFRLNVSITGTLSVGETVTDSITGATAKILDINTDYYVDIDFIIIARITGTFFAIGSELLVGGFQKAINRSEQLSSGAPTTKLHAYYKSLAADEFRPDTQPVPGSGPVRGVWISGSKLYAVRNNVGATEAVLHVAGASGWAPVPLGLEMAFTSGGTTEIEEGQTITGIVSGATAVLTRVVVQSGSWGSGDAAGRFIFASKTGNFQAAEGVQVGGSGDLGTVTANATAITLFPGGRFEFEDYNFFGNNRTYAVDGVNRGFEIDANPVSGIVITPLVTGMVLDKPTHLTIHKNHLFFAFLGSAQHSAIGNPYNWTPVLGAAELSVGDNITAFQAQPGDQGGGTLAILSRNRINMLYETSAANWQLVEFRREVGAFAYSVQEFGITLMMDDRGIIALEAAQEHGNFSSDVVSKLVQPFVNARKNLVNASSISRERSQYRVFFSDKTALYATTENSKILGFTPIEFKHVVTCVCSRENIDGTEKAYFGSDNGYVYLMDSGPSFDGEPIDYEMVLHFHNSKSPRTDKSYLDASFEIAGYGYSEFSFRYELDYNLVTTPQPSSKNIMATFSQSYWDSAVWDVFVWDGVILAPANVDMNGSGENISLIFAASSTYFEPITFSGAQLRLVFRNQLRS